MWQSDGATAVLALLMRRAPRGRHPVAAVLPGGLRHRRPFASAAPPAVNDPKSHVRLRFDTKVSESGSPDALFQEAIDAVRERRAELELDSVYRPSPAVQKLKQDELELTRKVFQRVDPDRDLTSDLAAGGHAIDPYWNPFAKVEKLKEQVTAEFDEYARCVSVVEAKRTRIQIKRSLKRCSQVHNPYSEDFRKWHGREKGFDQLPKPFRLTDKHWEKNPLQSRIEKEKITWRDVDIIQHFIADNGYILPRRTTMLSRLQQQKLVRAVKGAQRMALLPYTWRLKDFQAMPLMDPLQWMVDRLTERVVQQRDRRSRAMLQVLMERYPELNFRSFMAHESRRPSQSSVHETAVG